MSFQLRPNNTRPFQYPNVQDPNFLGYDRDIDRWKVDASGIKLYASGMSVELDHATDSVAVWSASGTRTLPTYLEGGHVDIDIDESTDSIRVYSTSGTPTIPTYLEGGFVDVDLDQSTDSVRVYSASGTTDMPVYITSPVEVDVRIDDSIKVLSASGTTDLPVYIQNEVRATDLDIRNIDEAQDDIRIYSASGTPDFNVYLENEVRATNFDIRDLDESQDNARIYSASGSAEIEAWINNQPIQTTVSDPLDGTLVKKRLEYNDNDDLATLKEASIVTPSGSPCKLSTFTYNGNSDIDYIIESLGTW